jgi:hypothetical protein
MVIFHGYKNFSFEIQWGWPKILKCCAVGRENPWKFKKVMDNLQVELFTKTDMMLTIDVKQI